MRGQPSDRELATDLSYAVGVATAAFVAALAVGLKLLNRRSP